MNFKDRDYSDEKLLAHVLGELDAAESLKFEEAAKNDPLLASRIESLKAECAKLADSFAEESRADAADEKITRERDEFIEAMLSLEAEHKKNELLRSIQERLQKIEQSVNGTPLKSPATEEKESGLFAWQKKK